MSASPTRPEALWLVALAGALVAPALARAPYSQVLLNMAIVNAINTVALYVLFGLTGILSVAQAAFWAIGAYTSAILATDGHLPVWLGFVVAPAAAGLAGAALALPTLGLRSHYLTIATIGFAEVTRLVLVNWDPVTRGPSGISGIPAPSLGGFSLAPYRRYYYLGLALLVLVAVAVERLRRSRLGRGLEAVRDDELAAESSGIPAGRLKVLAFSVSALVSGLAGALYAHLQRYVSPDAFTLDHTMQMLAMLMVGGRRSLGGAIAGAVLLTYLPEALRGLEDWYMAIYGGGLLAILVFLPGGLAGAAARVWARRGRTA